jgi:hypothetical protein
MTERTEMSFEIRLSFVLLMDSLLIRQHFSPIPIKRGEGQSLTNLINRILVMILTGRKFEQKPLRRVRQAHRRQAQGRSRRSQRVIVFPPEAVKKTSSCPELVEGALRLLFKLFVLVPAMPS